jgi:hypothetical protein
MKTKKKAIEEEEMILFFCDSFFKFFLELKTRTQPKKLKFLLFQKINKRTRKRKAKNSSNFVIEKNKNCNP